jgi:putative transposase
MGLLLVVFVHSAGVQDRDGARQLLQWALWHLPRLWTIFADSAYVGAWYAWVDYLWSKESGGLWRRCRWMMEFVKRASGAIGFQVLPRRWIVERTFAWLSRYRRLSKDYEYLPKSSEAFVYLASIHLMVRRPLRN